MLPHESAWAEIGRLDPLGAGHVRCDIVPGRPVSLSQLGVLIRSKKSLRLNFGFRVRVIIDFHHRNFQAVVFHLDSIEARLNSQDGAQLK